MPSFPKGSAAAVRRLKPRLLNPKMINEWCRDWVGPSRIGDDACRAIHLGHCAVCSLNGTTPRDNLVDSDVLRGEPAIKFMGMRIVEVTQTDMSTVRELFREYQAGLGIDLCFQDFERELATLPGRYALPAGAIFLAFHNREAIGCVAIRPRLASEAELKRLYVRPNHQRRGVGKQLFEAAMTKAKAIGYSSVVLDTLQNMRAAKSLYVAHGFKPIPAYYNNPEQGAEYYRCPLA